MPRWVRALLSVAPFITLVAGLLVGYQVGSTHQTPRIVHGNALDNYRMIVRAGIPMGQPIAATADGPATVTPYGRIYIGPNGVELRLDRGASELALGSGRTTPTDLPALFKGVYGYLWSIDTSQFQPLPAGQCLGVTIPPLALRSYLRSEPLAPDDLSIWKEECA